MLKEKLTLINCGIVGKCHVVSNNSNSHYKSTKSQFSARSLSPHRYSITHKLRETRNFDTSMEGVGSRLGRASSRYGPATVFNGPVRKWKKKWVHVSPSSSSTLTYHNSQSNAHTGSRLLLCKWTPLSSGEADRSFGKADEPPRRKFRYTPVSSPSELHN